MGRRRACFSCVSQPGNAQSIPSSKDLNRFIHPLPVHFLGTANIFPGTMQTAWQLTQSQTAACIYYSATDLKKYIIMKRMVQPSTLVPCVTTRTVDTSCGVGNGPEHDTWWGESSAVRGESRGTERDAKPRHATPRVINRDFNVEKNISAKCKVTASNGDRNRS